MHITTTQCIVLFISYLLISITQIAGQPIYNKFDIEQRVVDRYFTYVNDFNDPEIFDHPASLDQARNNFINLFSYTGSTSVINDLDRFKLDKILTPYAYVQSIINDYDGNVISKKQLVYFCLEKTTGNYRAIVQKTVVAFAPFSTSPIDDKQEINIWLDFIIDKYDLKILKIRRLTPPAGRDYDIDGDGIFDSCDACNKIPGSLLAGGTNNILDVDGDCIPNEEDPCPEQPRNGCKKPPRIVPPFGLTLLGGYSLPFSDYGEDFFSSGMWNSASNGAKAGWSGEVKLDINPLRFFGITGAIGTIVMNLDEARLASGLENYLDLQPGFNNAQVSISSDAYNNFYFFTGVNLGWLGSRSGIHLSAMYGQILGDLSEVFGKNEVLVDVRRSTNVTKAVYSVEFTRVEVLRFGLHQRWANRAGSFGFQLHAQYLMPFPSRPTSDQVVWDIPGLLAPPSTELVNIEYLNLGLGFFFSL